MAPLKICLVASEVAPLAKTGGLADVAAALARFLGGAGHDVRVVMPLYPRVRDGDRAIQPQDSMKEIALDFGERKIAFSISTTKLPQSGVEIDLVDCPELYDRDQIYTADPDEALRFALLCRATLEACQRRQWAPDVFHCNDWHTALLPLYLRTIYAWDGLFASTRTLLTIHNIGYQGVFPAETLDELGLGGERSHFDADDLREGRFSFLKTGLMYADGLTTVSETYAREIQTEDFGMGLEGLLRERSDRLVGIVNGVDYAEWNPATDPLIPHNYSADDLAGKAKNKTELLRRFELPEDPDVPLLGVVSRLAPQKGFELMPDALAVLLHRDAVRLVVLGSGEERYEKYFSWLRESFPDKVGFHAGYDNELAHWIEAGADLFLMPSRYEPCGLNQMYSLKYGTVPLVRKTGGLADTVRPFDAANGRGTGFLFEEFDSNALLDTIRGALEVYRDPDAWLRLVRNGMGEDYSWDRQGKHYVDLYERLIG